ncbi:MATE family efflux transporter [Marinomonas sp.]
MSSQSFLRKNILIAWPLALNGLLMQSMLMIDTFLVSPLGEAPLAAMGISAAVLVFMLGVHMALANGTQLILSRAVGSGSSSSVAIGFWAGLAINCTVSVFFWLLLCLFDEALVARLVQGDELLTQTLSYLAWAKYLVPFTALTQVMTALLNSQGQSKVPLHGYLLEMPLNTLFSYCLISGVLSFQGMGVAGAALGSVLAIVLRTLYLAWYVRFKGTMKLSLKTNLRAFFMNMKQHSFEIFPVAANITILQIGISVYQLLYSQLSLNAYAAIIIIMPWLRGGSQFITAWAHATAISISQLIGSRNLKDLPQCVNKSIDVAVAVSIACGGLFAVLSFCLPYFYSSLEADTYIALAAIAPLYIFLPMVRGYNTVHGHVLRALGKTTAVFKINFTGQWLVSIPLCAALILYWDVSIFWAFAVQPFEEIVKALPFRHLARKSLKEFDEDKMKSLLY